MSNNLPYYFDKTGKPIFNPKAFIWQKMIFNPLHTDFLNKNPICMSWLVAIDKNNPYNHGVLDYNKPWVSKEYRNE